MKTLNGTVNIDFSAMDWENGSATIKGMYKRIAEATKPIKVNNVEVGAEPMSPFYSAVYPTTYNEKPAYCVQVLAHASTEDGAAVINIYVDEDDICTVAQETYVVS